MTATSVEVCSSGRSMYRVRVYFRSACSCVVQAYELTPEAALAVSLKLPYVIRAELA